MAKFFDIDTTLRLNGDFTMGSGFKITSSGLIVTSGSITGNIISGGTIYEGGTSLSSKYLGISATAADSSKLGGSANTTYVQNARTITAGTGLSGGGDLSTNRTISVLFGTGGTQVASGNHLHDSRYLQLAGGVLTGALIGTSITGSSISGGTGVFGALSVGTNAVWHAGNINPVDTSRLITTSAGLLGGGSLTSDLTLSADFAGTGVSDQVARSDHNHDLSYFPLAGGNISGSVVFFGDQDYKGVYWGRLQEQAAGGYTQEAFIRQGVTEGQLEIGSDDAIDIYESDSMVLAIQISTNNKTLDAKGGLLENGVSLSSKYLSISGTAVNSDKLDNLDSTAFLRADVADSAAAEITFLNGIRFTPISAFRIASVFASGNTSQSFINFNAVSGSSDPGFIMHETSSVVADNNKGVIHICPSDDNDAVNDYVAIHGTNDPETIKIYTTGKVYTPANIQADGGFNVGASAVWHAGNLSPVSSTTSGQSVAGNFTISGDGDLWVGSSTSGGSAGGGQVIIRDGIGTNRIQAGGSKVANTNTFFDTNGNASFIGTVTANALIINSTGNVANLNASYINGYNEGDFASTKSTYDSTGFGIVSGLAINSQAVPNSTVIVSGGVVYTDSGTRVALPTQSPGFANNTTSFDRIDALIVQGSSAVANEGTLFIIQGTGSAVPARPTVPSDSVLLAYVSIRHVAAGQTISILQSDITDARMYKDLYFDGSFINITTPIKSKGWATSITIAAGSTTATWTHNLNLGNYAVTWSTNSPNRHTYWSSKSANSIVFNLDDSTDTSVVIDAVITPY